MDFEKQVEEKIEEPVKDEPEKVEDKKEEPEKAEPKKTKKAEPKKAKKSTPKPTVDKKAFIERKLKAINSMSNGFVAKCQAERLMSRR